MGGRQTYIRRTDQPVKQHNGRLRAYHIRAQRKRKKLRTSEGAIEMDSTGGPGAKRARKSIFISILLSHARSSPETIRSKDLAAELARAEQVALIQLATAQTYTEYNYGYMFALSRAGLVVAEKVKLLYFVYEVYNYVEFLKGENCFGGPGIDGNKEPGLRGRTLHPPKEVHVNTALHPTESDSRDSREVGTAREFVWGQIV